MWIFNPEQLVRVILSRPPSEVHKEHSEIIGELQNATQKRIIIDEIRYHVDSMGRIRMDWCDMFFHAVEPSSQMIVPVDDILKVIDSHYDFLKVGSNQRNQRNNFFKISDHSRITTAVLLSKILFLLIRNMWKKNLT